MNNDEAVILLDRELAILRDQPYATLVTQVSAEPLTLERIASDGTRHQIEIQVFWDDHPGGNVRVLGSIDDGGWRSFAPLNRDFIKRPETAV